MSSQDHKFIMDAAMGGLMEVELGRAYAKMMLKDHEKDVKEFERQSTKGADADLRAFATKALPTLQEHLQMARALPGNEGSGNSNSGSKNSNSNRP